MGAVAWGRRGEWGRGPTNPLQRSEGAIPSCRDLQKEESRLLCPPCAELDEFLNPMALTHVPPHLDVPCVRVRRARVEDDLSECRDWPS